MDSPINTRSLKEKFYNQHIKEYFDFVHDTDLSSRNRRGLSKTLSKLNDQVKLWIKDKELFSVSYGQDDNDPDKKKEIRPFLKIDATEMEMVISVEEFFLIIDKRKDLKEKVDQILTYTEKQSGNGSIPELEQTTEDTIIRGICQYFWKEYRSKEKRIIDIEKPNKENLPNNVDHYYYQNLKAYTYEDLINIIANIIAPIKAGKGIVNFLHICRKIRNIDVHNGRFFGLKDGYEINCFRLFTYMATVLLLRMSLEEKEMMDHFEFAKVTMPVYYPKGSSCVIKLYSGNEEILPNKSKDGVVEYDVEWYRLYRLDISQPSVSEERIFTWNEFYPYADFNGTTLVIGNLPNASSRILNRSFHDVAESLKKVEEVLVDIDTKTANINNSVSNIDTKLDLLVTYGQNNIEILGGLRNDVRDCFQELIESFQQFIKNQSNPLEDILILLKEQHESKQIEIEGKRKRSITLNSVVIVFFLTLALFSFISSILYDHSLLWLSHTTSILCITLILSCVFVYSIWRYCKLSNMPHNIKFAVSIGVSFLFALFVGGSYYFIPYKTSQDLIVKYDFSAHDKRNNVYAAEIIEDYLVNGNTNDEATTKLLNYYINIEKDSINIDKAVVLSKQVVDNISIYPKSSIYAAYAFFTKANFSNDKKLYAPINFIFDNYKELSSELTCLKGIMTVYGLGVERNVQEGISMLRESADKGNSKAQYYLGFVYSRDLTDWAALKKGKEIRPFNNIDLYTAIYYLNKAAKERPEASLELANIYSDLNLIKKASDYYKMTIEKSDGEVLKSAYFKMGLLQERLGNEYNEYLTKAFESAYGPAILYKAKREKDHVKLIGYYLSTSKSSKTYIPPIVFEYMYEAEFDNALKALQTAHVNGGFDMNFINGMKYLLGITVEKDSIIGNEYMKKSANNGCVFAKMIREFRKQDSNPKFQFSSFNEYCNEIPFAHVLRSWLLAKRGDMFQAQPEAMEAISLGHPAGAYMLKYTEHKGFKVLAKWEMAFRALPNTMNKQDCVNLGFFYNFITYVQLEHKPIPIELLEFWGELAIENHSFDAECWILKCWEISNEKLSNDNYLKLLEAALVDAQGRIPYPTLTYIAYKINEIPSFKEQLKYKYKYEPHIQEILSITPESRYYQVEEKTGEPYLLLPDLEGEMDLKYITDWQILNELSDTGNNYLDYYPM